MVAFIEPKTASKPREDPKSRSGSNTRSLRSAYPRSISVKSGSRFYSPNLHTWINRDPIEEIGGINLYEFVQNQPSSLIDFYGLTIFGPAEIVALDKNYPSSQTTTYSSSGVCKWKTEGVLAINGADNQDTVSVYPTTESASKNDSKVIAGNDELQITVRRPFRVSRPGNTIPRLSYIPQYFPFVPAMLSFKMNFKWRIDDQFSDPLQGVTVGEKISNQAFFNVFSYVNQNGGNTTDANGEVPDTYSLTFQRPNGWYSFTQTITVGNWEADTASQLNASGDWSGSLGALFH